MSLTHPVLVDTIAALALGGCLSTAAAAQVTPPAPVPVSVASVQARLGAFTRAELMIDGPGVSAGFLTLRYDAAVVEALTLDNASPTHCMVGSNVNKPGVMRIGFICWPPSTDAGLRFVITMDANASGESPVHLARCTLLDRNSRPLTCTSTDGQITIMPNRKSAGAYIGSCHDQCGGSAGSCWCDALCTSLQDCCGDFSQECTDVTPGEALVSLPDITAGPDGQATADISIETADRVLSGSFRISYDPTVVVPTSIVPAAGLPNDCMFVANPAVLGQIRMAFACVDGLPPDTPVGPIVSVGFQANAPGTTALHFEYCDVNDNQAACTPTDGNVTAAPPVQ